jgi:hypothetical protein
MKLVLAEDLGFAILLGPPSKEEAWIVLRTTISSSFSFSFSLCKKKKARKE